MNSKYEFESNDENLRENDCEEYVNFFERDYFYEDEVKKASKKIKKRLKKYLKKTDASPKKIKKLCKELKNLKEEIKEIKNMQCKSKALELINCDDKHQRKALVEEIFKMERFI